MIWNVTENEIDELISENHKRLKVIFGPYDPYSGLNCYDFDKRIPIVVDDFPGTSKMWVHPECFQNIMFRQVAECGSIRRYLIEKANLEPTPETVSYVAQQMCMVRAKDDPEFGIYITDRIQDKFTGEMISFRLNYPQRQFLALIEDMRREGIGIYIIVGKARQWGGSTLSQLFMKWIQDFRHDGWNAIVIAQTKDTAKKIKAMYKKAVQRQDAWTLGHPNENLVLSPYENSVNDFIVTIDGKPIRRSILTVSAYEIVDNARGENYHMAHMSEVAYWKKTQEHDPEAVISSILGGIRNQADNVVIFESTGRGASGFFYDTWQEARDPDTPSIFRPLFVPFYIIENDHMPLAEIPGTSKDDSPAKTLTAFISQLENATAPTASAEDLSTYTQAERDFAKWLLQNRDLSVHPKGYKESGKFFWRLWKLGASFEAINWYRINRNAARDHATWATEAPVDDVEMFKTSGNLVFNPYSVAELRDECVAEPTYRAEIVLTGKRDKFAIKDSVVKLRDDGTGELKIWKVPNNKILRVRNRYLVSVDIGGNSARADYSVMTVIDRMGTISGVNGKPEVVARYRAHCRHDKLAWKAAVLAEYYDHAMLVIESNTADRERNSNTEGDHFGTIIEEISRYYNNLYMRASPSEDIREAPLRKYGFQTNRLNKPWLIDNLIANVEDKLFVDPDSELYHELSIYERREDGSLGNIAGANNHDDVLMSLAIGLWISANDMQPASWIKNSSNIRSIKQTNINEASF